MPKRISLVLFFIWYGFASAQTKPEAMNPFEKKFRVGLDVNLLWSTIDGDKLANNYFSKPSVGIAVAASYYFKSFVGVSVGVGYQQLGAGITTAIKNPIVGQAPDSTYRTRLRFNTWVVPISIHLRTPKEFIFESWRLGGSLSVIPTFNASSRWVYVSLEPSLRVADANRDVSSQYFKTDLQYRLALGPEINAGTGIFRFQVVYMIGTANVYANGLGNGTNQSVGFSLGYQF